MSAKTCHGSCHCGKVRYEVNLDLAQGTFKCNCRICTKSAFWGASVKPEVFRLMEGEDYLFKYGNPEGILHFFCKMCGIKVFGRGKLPEQRPFVAINARTLDDVDPKEWVQAPINYTNGREDRWDEAPAFTKHL